MINVHSESVDFVMHLCLNYLCVFLGAFLPFQRRTQNPQRNLQQNSRQNPCKSTHVVKNGVGKSTLQEEGSTNSEKKHVGYNVHLFVNDPWIMVVLCFPKLLVLAFFFEVHCFSILLCIPCFLEPVFLSITGILG